MKDDRLYDVVDYILNRATEAELEVVRAALKRRIEGGDVRGAMGLNPERLAHEAASSIEKQLGGSIDQMRGMVRKFAGDVIRREAPELDERQIQELLGQWVPEKPTARKRPTKSLPPEAVLSMLTQFVAYSTESMSVSQQLRLREEIPDWQRKYWEAFSPRLRSLVTLLLNGELDEQTFWERACGELGIDPGSIAKEPK